MKVFWDSIRGLVSKGFNLPVIKKSRLHWVDYLRGIAIILIVYRHVLIGIQRGDIRVPEGFVTANMIFYSFRMPLFFILSGIFISHSIAKKSIRKLIGIKFEKLIYPYLIWVTIQISLQIIFSGITNSNRSLVDYTYIFYQPRFLDQFWYLPALFNTTLIYILLKTKLKFSTGVQLLLGLVLYFASPYFQKISMLSDWMAFYFFFALGDAISGMFFKEKSLRYFKSPIALVMVIPFFILSQRYYLMHLADLGVEDKLHLSRPDYFSHFKDQLDFLFIALVGCLSMFILCFRLQSIRFLSFLRILGFHSLYIYVMHVIISASIRLSLIIVFHMKNPIILLFSSMTIGLIIPILFYNYFIKDGPLWFLFSFRKKEEPVGDEIKIIQAPASQTVA
jgi:fucose 4-O-acetylase-like acetyltransferase